MNATLARARRAPGALGQALPPDLARRLLIALAAAAALVASYMFVIRDLPLFAVDDVRITGLTARDSAEIRAAIEAEARDMTTLHVRGGDLEAALERFPVVRSVEVRADFPSGLRVHVVEHHPAALIHSGRAKVPVAADGSVLRGLPADGPLARIEVKGALPADRIRGERLLGLLRVAGAAPAPLARRIEGVDTDGERGIVVTLRDGPELVFGTPARARAKWVAGARVLADGSSKGAAYVDLRLPERPAAGGVVEEAPVEPLAAEPVDPEPLVADPAAVDPVTGEPLETAPVEPAAEAPVEPIPEAPAEPQP